MTSSGTSSSSLLSFVPSASQPSNHPPQPESSSSFGEVMQKQADDSSSSSHADANANASSTSEKSTSASNPDAHSDSTSFNSTSTPDDTPTPIKGGGGKAAHGKKAPATKAADAPGTTTLKSMLVRASALASGTTTATPAPAKDAKGNPVNDESTSDDANLAALIAQMLALAAGAKTIPTPTAATTSTATKDNSDEKDAKDAEKSSPTAPDIATLIAQASIMAFNGQATTAATTAGRGKEIPVLVSTKVASAGPGKEKKSSSQTGEGSFLHSDTSAASSASSLLGLLGVTPATTQQDATGQQLVSDLGSKKSAVPDLAALASKTAGTANVEREKTMNADQNLPTLLNGVGTSTGLHDASSDMQIKLSSNTNFENALKTVLHIASLNEVSQSRASTRVAIELQTPPGAIVNVYVTKQNDQWRAQLSTNDPQALSWVQDKMSSLKQTTDTGVDVKWLPPQIETITTSSSSESNLGWDRGGDNQSQYQNPDERQQSNRQQRGDEAELVGAGSNFMQTLISSGRSS